MYFLRWFVLLVKPLVSRFPRVAAMYRGLRDQLDCMEEPQPTPWGFKLAGNSAMMQGTFEPVETKLVRKLLEEVDVLINVGANVGYYCCHALSMGKSVIAFEPMDRNLRYLCKNIKANGWSGVEIFPVALSNGVDIIEIYGGNTGASLVAGWAGISQAHVTLVPSSTMDLILGDRLSGRRALIIVDIEGAEKWMLDGALKILENDPSPIWIVEITSRELQPSGVRMNPNFKKTFDLFFSLGYQAYDLEDDMNMLSSLRVDDIFNERVKFCGNNFVFKKSSD